LPKKIVKRIFFEPEFRKRIGEINPMPILNERSIKFFCCFISISCVLSNNLLMLDKMNTNRKNITNTIKEGGCPDTIQYLPCDRSGQNNRVKALYHRFGAAGCFRLILFWLVVTISEMGKLLNVQGISDIFRKAINDACHMK
jgi:hypothetical protein